MDRFSKSRPSSPKGDSAHNRPEQEGDNSRVAESSTTQADILRTSATRLSQDLIPSSNSATDLPRALLFRPEDTDMPSGPIVVSSSGQGDILRNLASSTRPSSREGVSDTRSRPAKPRESTDDFVRDLASRPRLPSREGVSAIPSSSSEALAAYIPPDLDRSQFSIAGSSKDKERAVISRPGPGFTKPDNQIFSQAYEGMSSITRGDIISSADTRPIEHSNQFEMTSAAERGEAPDGPIRGDARRVLRDLKYNPDDPDALEKVTNMHRLLQEIDVAKKQLEALKEDLVKNAPGPTGGGWWKQLGSRIYTFNFPKKAALEQQITRWEAQIRGPRDTSTLSGFVAKQMDRANKPVEWFLRKTGRVGEFSLVSAQGGVATAFPSFTAKHFVWGTIFTNIIGAGVTSQLFKEATGPARAPINTAQWEVWNVAGVALQERIDAATNHTDNSTPPRFGNSTIHQVNSAIRPVGKFETRALSDFMSERLNKFQGRDDAPADEIADTILKSFDDFLAQRGHSAINW